MTKFSSKIEVLHFLRAWEGILRALGCSKAQVRELYRLPHEDGLRISEGMDMPALSLELEAEDEARDQVDQPQN